MTEELLRRAAELVRAGWTRGTLVRPDADPTEYCLAGAICAAGIERRAGPEVVEAYRLTALAIGQLWPGKQSGETPIGTIIAWNDAPERTLEDVVEALDHAEGLVGTRIADRSPRERWFRRSRTETASSRASASRSPAARRPGAGRSTGG